MFVNKVGVFSLTLLDNGGEVCQWLSVNHKPWANPEQAAFFLTQRGQN